MKPGKANVHKRFAGYVADLAPQHPLMTDMSE
jgi:hypothetical protein